MKEKRGEKERREKMSEIREKEKSENEMRTNIRVEFGGIRKKKEGKRGRKNRIERERKGREK